MDDDDEEGEEEEEDVLNLQKKLKMTKTMTKKIPLKNPTVDTSFLPDREREEKDRLAREELRQEWLKKQELMKGEEIEIIYSYWDGSGHRKSLTVRMRKMASDILWSNVLIKNGLYKTVQEGRYHLFLSRQV